MAKKVKPPTRYFHNGKEVERKELVAYLKLTAPTQKRCRLCGKWKGLTSFRADSDQLCKACFGWKRAGEHRAETNRTIDIG